MNLPPEVRNRIYAYVFSGNIQRWNYKSPKSKMDSYNREPIPAIIRACKQTHAEATPIYYAEATFLFKYDTRFTQWARAIGHERCHMLREVCIKPVWDYDLYLGIGTDPKDAIQEYGQQAQLLLAGFGHLEGCVKKGVIESSHRPTAAIL